ncbi:putative proline-rich receptor-like protein kinase PERK2 [Iris pallida]|uniref:Proline-rich receptor-like protein kinase PERK2 n=1 Tax=Iris pallida TaxID=29817 RepID=A0AAX6ENV7_IRIPA|nr:putative proline-rich receptor-like protein kinase PERK2 [Iris pallida]
MGGLTGSFRTAYSGWKQRRRVGLRWFQRRCSPWGGSGSWHGLVLARRLRNIRRRGRAGRSLPWLSRRGGSRGLSVEEAHALSRRGRSHEVVRIGYSGSSLRSTVHQIWAAQHEGDELAVSDVDGGAVRMLTTYTVGLARGRTVLGRRGACGRGGARPDECSPVYWRGGAVTGGRR